MLFSTRHHSCVSICKVPGVTFTCNANPANKKGADVIVTPWTWVAVQHARKQTDCNSKQDECDSVVSIQECLNRKEQTQH